MNTLEARLFAAELRQDLPTLDLHGFYPKDALEKLEHFLYEQLVLNESAVKIVYGAGTGILAASVLGYLRSHRLKVIIKDMGAYCLVLF